MSVERDLRKAARFGGEYLTRSEAERKYGRQRAEWGQIVGRPAVFPPSVHVHDVADVAGLPEAVMDTVAGFVVAGSNVTVVHNDGADTLTVSASGGGGGSPAMAWVI